MDKYYFIAGEYCSEGMGRNYYGHGAKFLIVSAKTYNKAYSIALNYSKHIFGPQEYKDMWYGEFDWNWKVEPHTEEEFKQIYKNRFNLVNYHANIASKIFSGAPLGETKKVDMAKDFVASHPILELKHGKIFSFKGDIEEFIGNKKEIKEVVFEGPFTDPETITVEETEFDKEFFS